MTHEDYRQERRHADLAKREAGGALPTEEDARRAYRRLLEELNGKPPSKRLKETYGAA